MKTATRLAILAALLAMSAHSIAGKPAAVYLDGFEHLVSNSYRIEVTRADTTLVGEACGFLEFAHVLEGSGGGITIADCATVTETPREAGSKPPAAGLHNLQVSNDHGFLGCSLTFAARTMVSAGAYRNVLAFGCP